MVASGSRSTLTHFVSGDYLASDGGEGCFLPKKTTIFLLLALSRDPYSFEGPLTLLSFDFHRGDSPSPGHGGNPLLTCRIFPGTREICSEQGFAPAIAVWLDCKHLARIRRTPVVVVSVE